ncbi:uncharacterized protein DUF1206 [Streptomyces sp. 3211.6]|uniref:DUF1206 domain-containing protein n=1 Tax=Streptomyces TaxID=1883 RepID=UPI0009A53B39|nr:MULTISPECIES: DUF1206 domain-containing protein [Streptomyces]RKT02531.1 uncharacterized protein DUF1206 [Streptomyces sp. 3211.6]RPF43855.1 uncharacterized protein DUF1206 [Streptomyces sp. Ag109_G2-6]
MAGPSGGGTTARETRAAVAVAARCGLATRGVLYVLVGVLALRVAFGSPGQAADRTGALAELAGHPFGRVLVWAVGAGLVAMALWRLSEAVFGSAGPDGRGPAKRVAAAARTCFYGVTAFSTLSFAAGHGGGRSSDEQSRDVTAGVLGIPAGPWLVGLAGLGVAIGGVVIIVGAARLSFREQMETSRLPRGARRAVDVLGVVGGVARGAVFTAAGAFLVHAAVSYDPRKAKGVDDTLRSFAQTPAGPWLLAAVAAGLLLFGVFSWAMAARPRV